MVKKVHNVTMLMRIGTKSRAQKQTYAKTASRVGAQQPKVRLLKKRRVFVFNVPLILAKKP